jgi:hypothetical protein
MSSSYDLIFFFKAISPFEKLYHVAKIEHTWKPPLVELEWDGLAGVRF